MAGWSSAIVFAMCCGLSAAMFPAMFPLPQDDKAGKFAEKQMEEFTNAFGNPFLAPASGKEGDAKKHEETDLYQAAMRQMSAMNPFTAFMAPWMDQEKEEKVESQPPKLVAPAAPQAAQQLAAAAVPKVPEPQRHLPAAPPKDPGFIDRSIAKPPPEVAPSDPVTQKAKTIAEGAAEQLSAVPAHAVSPTQLVPKSEVEAMQKDQKLVADDRKAKELQEKIKMGAESVDAKKAAEKLAAEAPASMGVQMNVASEPRPAQPPGISDCNVAFGTKFMNITQHAQWTCNRVKMPEDGKIEFCGCGKVMYNIMRCDGEQPEIFDIKYKELVITSQDGCTPYTCRYAKLPYDWYAGVPWLFYKSECSLATIVGGKNMVAHPEEDAKIVPVVINPPAAEKNGNDIANDGGK